MYQVLLFKSRRHLCKGSMLFKMADMISMSQQALPKVMRQRYISSQRYIPNNVTLKKRQKPSVFYDRCQPSAVPR